MTMIKVVSQWEVQRRDILVKIPPEEKKEATYRKKMG